MSFSHIDFSYSSPGKDSLYHIENNRGIACEEKPVETEKIGITAIDILGKYTAAVNNIYSISLLKSVKNIITYAGGVTRQLTAEARTRPHYADKTIEQYLLQRGKELQRLAEQCEAERPDTSRITYRKKMKLTSLTGLLLSLLSVSGVSSFYRGRNDNIITGISNDKDLSNSSFACNPVICPQDVDITSSVRFRQPVSEGKMNIRPFVRRSVSKKKDNKKFLVVRNLVYAAVHSAMMQKRQAEAERKPQQNSTAIIDASCQTSSTSITPARVIRKLGEFFSQPVTTLTTGLHELISREKCPSQVEMALLLATATTIDLSITYAISKKPNPYTATYLFFQTVIGPALILFADFLEGKKPDVSDIQAWEEQFSLMIRQINYHLVTAEKISIYSQNDAEASARIPPWPSRWLIDLDGKLAIEMEGVKFHLYTSKRDVNYVNTGERFAAVYYNRNSGKWNFLSQKEATRKRLEFIKKGRLYEGEEIFANALNVKINEDDTIHVERQFTDDFYIMVRDKFLRFEEFDIHGEKVKYFSTKRNNVNYLIKGEAGWYVEDESAMLQDTLAYWLKDNEVHGYENLLTTTIQDDGFSYDNGGTPFIKFQRKYFKVTYGNNEGVYFELNDLKFRLNRNNEKIIIEYAKSGFFPDESFYPLEEGWLASFSLLKEIKKFGLETASPIKNIYSEGLVLTADGQYAFSYLDKTYLIDEGEVFDGFSYAIKTIKGPGKNIQVYLTNRLILRGYNNIRENMPDYVKVHGCVAKRQVNPSILCENIFVSNKLKKLLKESATFSDDISRYEIVPDFSGLLKSKAGGQLFFQHEGTLYPARFLTNFKTTLRMETLEIFSPAAKDVFDQKNSLARIVSVKRANRIFIKTEEEELWFNTSPGRDEADITSEEIENLYYYDSLEHTSRDQMAASDEGLTIPIYRKLNSHWRITEMNFRQKRRLFAHSAGSEITIRFKLFYDPIIGQSEHFVEHPRLQWMETIRNKEGNTGKTWEIKKDMYQHDPLSPNFLFWRRRYTDAYNYARAVQNNPKMEATAKIYDKQMRPLSSMQFAYSLADKTEQAESVRNYLKVYGGFLEVTLYDLPRVNIGLGGKPTNIERMIKFEIGFSDKTFTTFTQVISVEDNVVEKLFVTTDDVKDFTQWQINAEPPENYNADKIPLLTAGEYLRK